VLRLKTKCLYNNKGHVVRRRMISRSSGSITKINSASYMKGYLLATRNCLLKDRGLDHIWHALPGGLL
jgi:hypothetical protein